MKSKISIALVIAFVLSAFLNRNYSQQKFGGLALYTVRDAMGNDPKETLKEVATLGYEYIEAAGYDNGKFYGMKPEEFKKYLETIGLTPLSTHQSSITFENADQMIADVKAAGFKYLVIPVPPMGHFKYDAETQTMYTDEDAASLTKTLNIFGEKCKKAGINLLYHNHNFEFKEDSQGHVIYDYLLEHTNPEYVNFEMDLYWTIKAGADPVSYFKKYPGRFIIWHVKDMDEQGRFAPVGTGTIDFSKILAQKNTAGMQYYFVEQDRTFNMEPLEAIKVSHQGLSKFGFK